MFAKTTVTPNAGQMYVQVECPNCSRLLAEVASLREKVEKYEYALRNCRLMASREFHKTKGESWDHVLRFCRDAGIEGSILREQEQG